MYRKIQFDEFLKFLLQNGHTSEAKAVHQIYRESMGTQSTNEDFESLSMECICQIGQEDTGHLVGQQERAEIETQIRGGRPRIKATFDDDNSGGSQALAKSSLGANITEAIDLMELRIMGIRP